GGQGWGGRRGIAPGGGSGVGTGPTDIAAVSIEAMAKLQWARPPQQGGRSRLTGSSGLGSSRERGGGSAFCFGPARRCAHSMFRVVSRGEGAKSRLECHKVRERLRVRFFWTRRDRHGPF